MPDVGDRHRSHRAHAVSEGITPHRAALEIGDGLCALDLLTFGV